MLGSGTYLEIIASDPEQPAPPFPRPFGLGNISRGRLAGWALRCEDIDAAIAHAQQQGYDPGAAMEFERAGPTGAVLRWRFTLNAVDGGPVPFLVGHYSEQPARSAPTGLTLDFLEIEDPNPASVTSVLRALGAEDVTVKAGTHSALVAHLTGPNGRHELR